MKDYIKNVENKGFNLLRIFELHNQIFDRFFVENGISDKDRLLCLRLGLL